MDYKYYYDNYIYNYKKIRQVLVFEVYDIIAKLSMMYMSIAKYFNLLLFSEYKRLLTRNFLRDLKIAVK